MHWYNSKRKQSLSYVEKENFFKLLLSKVNCESAGRGVYFRQCNSNECAHCSCNFKTLILICAPYLKVSVILNMQLFFKLLLLLLYWKYWRLLVDSNYWYKSMWRSGKTIIEGYELKKWYWTNWILFLQIHFCLSTHMWIHGQQHLHKHLMKKCEIFVFIELTKDIHMIEKTLSNMLFPV